MTTYEVTCEATWPPTITLQFDHQPSSEEITQALEALAQDMSFDGYMAEFMVTTDFKTTTRPPEDCGEMWDGDGGVNKLACLLPMGHEGPHCAPWAEARWTDDGTVL